MPSWNDGDESSDDDSMVVSLMDMEYFDTRDTIPEPLFRGAPMEEVPKCTLHEMMPRKCVSFEGANTRRRFYGCPVQNCHIKLWEMFHEQNLDRIQYKHAYDDEVAKLKKGHDHLYTEYHKMVDDFSKTFDWRDGIGKMDYHKAVDARKYEKKKEELEMEMKIEKLRLERSRSVS
ncbi:hypothetical protein ZWY2020_001678 [Hordeum vulgare]|nr:hypothetical protein ZWY2020_001678 [Hordeum vulgare]